MRRLPICCVAIAIGITLSACDQSSSSATPLSANVKAAVDHYQLGGVERSDLDKEKTHRSLVQLGQEPCNRDAMGSLGYELDVAGYRRQAANALVRFVDACGHADGFLSAALEDLMAVSDYPAAIALGNRLLASDPADPDYYFARGRAYEGHGDNDRALADYMQTIALIPDRRSITSNLFLRAADMHAKAGRYCDAISMIRMWMSADPDRANNAQAKNIIDGYATHQTCPSTYASGEDSFARQSGGTIRVKASINGVEGNFIVDTGATYVTLTRGFAKRAHVDTAQATKIRLQTANGPTEGLLTHAASVKVGHAQAADVAVSVNGPSAPALGGGIDGLLGQSFLSRFGMTLTPARWTIGKAG